MITYFVCLIKSLVKKILLNIALCDTKQSCSFDIVFESIFFNLFYKIFVRNLKSAHCKDIVLQYFSLFKFPFLGIRTIMT